LRREAQSVAEEPQILIADDHPLFREALKVALRRAAPMARVLEATNLAEALSVAAHQPDLSLVLLDLRMSDSQGFSGLAQLHAERPSTPILVVTGVEQPDAPQRARQFGAVGFVRKSEDLLQISAAIGCALRGEGLIEANAQDDPCVVAMAERIASLTPMQIRVLLGVLNGKLNKQIAFELNVGEATIKAHMTAVLRKLNVLNRTQAALAVRALDLEAEAPL
jgi:DNA-binding NarL/FixJ family response regulator